MWAVNISEGKMSEQERIELLTRFSLYIVEGTFLILVNFAMLLAIVRHSVLRSQYSILCGLLLTDCLMGLATVCAGVGRNAVLLLNKEDDLVSRRACMFQPWNILFIWTDPMTAIILLVVSIDRLIAICLPLYYFKHSGKLARWQLGVAHFFMLASVIVGWILTFPETDPLYSKICWSSKAMNTGFYIYHTWVRIAAALLSVVLYGIIVALMWMKAKSITASRRVSSHNIARFTKQQLRLTVSMGISCLCTCIFYVSPICVELFEVITGAEAKTLGIVITISLLISNLNSISNFFVLLHRHADIRRATLSLFSLNRRSAAVAPAVSNSASSVKDAKSVYEMQPKIEQQNIVGQKSGYQSNN